MIAFIEGKVDEKRAGELVVDVGGIGMQVSCSSNTVAAAPAIGERTRLHTVFVVREDAMELFGFSSREERTMFQKLIGITGIGPRSALAILSAMPLRDLTLALLTGDIAALSRAPGVGKKTAQRMVLELKEKLSTEEAALAQQAAPTAAVADSSATQEAVAALMSLGYSTAEATQAVARVQDQTDKTDQLILLALKQIGL